MHFRTKLLLIFLAISLGPLAFMRLSGSHLMRQFFDEAVPEASEEMAARSQERLRGLVALFASGNLKAKHQLEMGLEFQAQALVLALAAPAQPPSGPHFVSRQLEDQPPHGNLVAEDSMHQRLNRQGETQPLRLDRDHQVFKLAGMGDDTERHASMDRLASTTWAYALVARHCQTVMWQFTALTNGVYGAYPAHGYIPPGFDAREQYWYQRAVAENRLVWTLSQPDPISHQAVMHVAMPLRSAQGRLLGVTGMAVPTTLTLGNRELVDYLPRGAQVYLLLAHPPASAPPHATLVVAAPQNNAPPAFRPGSWRGEPSYRWLASDDGPEFDAMLARAGQGKSGAWRMSLGGQDSLWVCAGASDGVFWALVTPYAELVGPAKVLESSLQSSLDDQFRAVGFLITVVVFVVGILAFFVSRQITRPLEALAQASRCLREGDFTARVRLRSRDEFGEVGRLFNQVGPRLRELSQVRQALALAREVQQTLLPVEQPEIPGLEVAGRSVYCEQTGGDYYDYIPQEEEFFLAVGDVSGHGIPAALLMTSARAALRQRLAMGGGLDQVLSGVNRQLAQDTNGSGHFMTMFLAGWSVGGQRLRWARAGHDPGLLYDPATDHFQELAGLGLPLGVEVQIRYQELSLEPRPGMLLVVGTDGIWEATDADNEMFGKRRLRQLVREHHQQGAQAVLAAVFSALDEFRDGRRLVDDATLLVVRVV